MECVILFRYNGSGRIACITDTNGDIETFANRDEAIKVAEHHSLLQVCPFQIVEADEL